MCLESPLSAVQRGRVWVSASIRRVMNAGSFIYAGTDMGLIRTSATQRCPKAAV